MTESNIETTNQAPKSIRIFSDIYLFKNKAILLFCKKWFVFGTKTVINRKNRFYLHQSFVTRDPGFWATFPLLRTLLLLVPKMSSATVYAALQDLMPPVLNAINSTVSATRKEAVFLFVRVYNSVGDAHARPYMGKLSVAQSKLVTIYVQRSKKSV